MALTKLIVPPDQASYAVTDGKEALSVQLDGGASRFRSDIKNPASLVNVKWSVGNDLFTYLRAFYKTVSAGGALPFLIDLFLDEPYLTEHTAHFIPGTFKLSSQKGRQYVVSARLEVMPTTPDDEYNQALVDLYNEYGSFEVAQSVLDQLEQLVNIDLPSYISLSIDGTITGDTQKDVLITLSNGKTTLTDVNGNYKFLGLASGTYTATPTKQYYIFNPVSTEITITSNNIHNINFLATSSPPPP